MRQNHNACVPGVQEKVVEMAINSSGIRDTARVLKINKKYSHQHPESKEDSLVQVNPVFLSQKSETPLDVRLELVCEEVEIDEHGHCR
nr:IS1-like element transposase [Bathymodiolus japonicus methanotrophic gill symbiont]